MFTQKQTRRAFMAALLSLATGAIVAAFLALSLAITVTGTARFARAIGYSSEVGYWVGAVFDAAKALLPVALLGLVARRAFVLCAIIGSAWVGLVTYSALATHATIGLAIASLERSGAWKVESRNNIKAELSDVEQRLASLSEPKPPRPRKTIAKALDAEKVPTGVWRHSEECREIRNSHYYQAACAKVLSLRGELAAAEDYERLEARARHLRKALASARIVASSDPLPQAFAATLGRFLPVEGRVGVGLLISFVIESMSCFGLASLRALREGGGSQAALRGSRVIIDRDEGRPSGSNRNASQPPGNVLPSRVEQIVPQPRLHADQFIQSNFEGSRTKEGGRPTNVATRGRDLEQETCREGMPPAAAAVSEKAIVVASSHVTEFARARLCREAGTSLGASALKSAYIKWCAENAYTPLSQQRLGVALTGLGFTRWKSCGVIRYRNVQLAT